MPLPPLSLPPPPKLITPKEFTDRTALGLFSPRGPETLAMDKAYAAYYQQAVGQDLTGAKLKVVSLNLLQALTALVLVKGGNWELVNRDRASKGLLREWHGFLELHWGAELAKTLKAEKAALGWDLVRSRFGAIYLLGNLEIGVDWRIMLGEALAQGGSAAVAGGMAGTGHAATFGESNVSLGVTSTSVNALTSGGAAVTGLATSAVSHSVVTTQQPTASRFDIPEESRWTTTATYPKSVREAFPCTAELFDTAVKEYHGVSDIPGMIVGGAIGGAVAVTIDIAKTTVESIWKALHDVVNWVQKKMFHDDEFATRTIAAVSKPIVGIVLAQVWKAAAPFIGGAMQIGTGIAQTVKAAVDKIALWWDRSQVKLTEGHFTLISETIESQVTKGLFYGLWTALKGAADIAMNTFLPGAGSLVSMLMGGIEWLIKALCRIVESRHVAEFLKKARTLWETEKKLAKTVTDESNPSHVHYEPKSATEAPASLVHKTKDFAKFFKEGCDTSPVIPMVTLNSGLAGSIYQAIEMLLTVPGGTKMIDQKSFDAGVAYFDRLKRISHEYLVSCGFIFSTPNKSLEGIVHHAVMDNHRLSTGMKILTGLAT